MKSMPFYLSDAIMPLYKVALVIAFLIGASSIFVPMGYTLCGFVFNDLALIQAAYSGFMIFLKGIALTAVIGCSTSFAFWKRHQINYENCKQSNRNDCMDLSFFHFA
jgi:hypothetical protein